MIFLPRKSAQPDHVAPGDNTPARASLWSKARPRAPRAAAAAGAVSSAVPVDSAADDNCSATFSNFLRKKKNGKI